MTHHLTRRGLLRLAVGAVLRHVGTQPRQQRQHAVHAFMAGFEHLERLFETRGGAGDEGLQADRLGHGEGGAEVGGAVALRGARAALPWYCGGWP